jgi:hypothetical protein
LHSYFAALLGLGDFPAVRCNAPEFSAVVGVHGEVSPCVFIRGPEVARIGAGLRTAIDLPVMQWLRADIRAGKRPECERCVCSLWRDPQRLDHARFLLGGRYV